MMGSHSLSFAWVSVENLTSRAPRSTKSYNYTQPGFYKTLWYVIIYYLEAKYPNLLMSMQNLNNWSSFSNCRYSEQKWDLPSTSGLCPAPVELLLARDWAACHQYRKRSLILLCPSKSDTFGHLSFNSSFALLC